MKRIALMTVVIAASLSGVACSKDKKKATQKEMIHACLWDQTGDCQRKAAAYASSPAILPIAAQVGNNPNLLAGIQNGTIPVVIPPAGAPGAAPPVVGGGTAIQSVEDAIKAQAKKVNDGIIADTNNPNSLRYDPPQRSPASIQPASVPSADSAPSLPSAGYDASAPGDGIR